MLTLEPCTRCRGQTAISPVDAAAGDATPLAVALKAMPVAACEKGHGQFVHPEFARRLLERLMQEGEPALPAGVEKGLLVKRYHCAGCGAGLAPRPDRTHTFWLEVALPDLDTFQSTRWRNCTSARPQRSRRPSRRPASRRASARALRGCLSRSRSRAPRRPDRRGRR
jgi:hypothetical protein